MADFKLSLLMTAIMSCLITGCGGGGHSSSEGSQNTQLEVQVIDGYLTGIDVCIVTNENLECDAEFGTAKTDDNGKSAFEINDKQKKKLEQMKSVKFKAVAKKGTTDIILGKKTETKNDMVLLGTKFFESGELNSKPDKKKSFKLTPFTTMAEMIHSGKVSNKDEYEETLKQIAESLKTDLDTIQSDYNNTEGDNKDQNIAALLGGELMAALNMLPKTINEIATTKEDEIIKITLKSLETIKELADGLKEKLLGIDGNIKDDIDLIEIMNDKLKVLNSSFVSLSTGLADEWRCGVTKANEVWCWGNNAWNNLGNQEFTQSKLNFEKYTIEGTDALMYLNNNYSAEPLPVLIKNPDKKTDEDPEYIHLSGITKVATGNTHGCAITLNREVYCWGGNYNGQLGIGKDGFMNTYKEPVGYASKVVTGKQNAKSGYLSNVVDLSLGQNHSCALTADGDIYCWGDNTALELGAAHEKDRMHRPEKIMSMDDYDISEYLWMIPYPVKVPAPEGVKFRSITQSGYWAHCALSTPETTDKEGHNLWCWGDDNRGLISGNNKQYAQEIIDNWADKIVIKNEKTTRYYSPEESWYWHYRESGGDWFPMFGKPITNIKSYKLFESVVCKEYDQNDCWQTNLHCDQGTLIYSGTRNGICKSSQVGTFEMKNIKTIDIVGFDSQLYFTTTETADSDKTLHELYTNSMYGIYEKIVASANELNNEKIRSVHLGAEGFGRFIITEEGNLYGFGSQYYGILGNGINSIDDSNPNVIKIAIDENRPNLQVKTLSANKRSACASVEEQNADDPDKLELYCWGSSTFGQLGFDNGDNDFSYGDISTKWNDHQNELMDKPSRIQTTPKQVLTDFTFDD